MKKSTIFMFAVILLLGSGKAFSQSELQIFGFFQGTLTSTDGKYSVIADVPKAVFGTDKLTLAQQSQNSTTSNLQQLNLLFRKEFSESFTGWVNIEFANSFNSVNKWGQLSLEEAWVNYQGSNSFNLKVGYIIPKFGYLNEIKNRWPLLPYITRPLIYETSNKTIDISHFVPEKAFAQVSGNLSFGSASLEYAAYVGNSEKSYISSVSGGSLSDTSGTKMFGGRIGLKTGDLSFGVSGTVDKENRMADLKENVSRKRLAFDAQYVLGKFFADGEYITVNMSPSNTSKSMNKSFYYLTLGCNVIDELYLYGSYSYLKDEYDMALAGGMNGYIVGAGYKPNDNLVFKLGYSKYQSTSSLPVVINPALPAMNTNIDINYNLFQLAVSVLF